MTRGNTTVVLQKVLYPALRDEFLSGRLQRIGGFVLRAQDAVAAQTPAQLHEAFALGYPGSPYDPNAPFVDVIRFQPPRGPVIHDAISPAVVDHPPYTGTGFAPWPDHVAPVYLLDETPLPAGAEMWRVSADGSEDLVAVHPDVATGWLQVAGGEPVPRVPILPSTLAWHAIWQGQDFVADVTRDGIVLLAAEQLDGFEATRGPAWRRVVPAEEVTDVFRMRLECRYRGLPCLVTDSGQDENGTVLRLAYIGHDAEFAEGMSLHKLDAGWYWTAARQEEIEGLQGIQERFEDLPHADA
ncbi:hypothetical protein [Tersicoccus solisilvae]|uniref:hypothetical protein n=1 Tax=Tersicoccus solisilvae TaxID=1882339 RepID=UPI0016651600|nr:hypothetical protein [Tersicoccus solisilvae]